MKITKQQLKQIIKEEINKMISEDPEALTPPPPDQWFDQERGDDAIDHTATTLAIPRLLAIKDDIKTLNVKEDPKVSSMIDNMLRKLGYDEFGDEDVMAGGAPANYDPKLGYEE